MGHILRRICHIKHVTEGKLKGKTEGMGTRGRKRKVPPDGPTAKMKLEEELL